jgi:hypothetical protein
MSSHPAPVSAGTARRAAFLAVGLAGLLLAGCSSKKPTGGALEVTPNPVEIGVVAYQEQVERELTLTNRGERTVTLLPFKFDCSCFTIERPPSSLLRPGESVRLRLVMLTGKTDPREFHKRLSIPSDDPAMPVLLVPIHGEVVQYRTVRPPIVRAGPIAAGTEWRDKVEVRAGAGFSLAVTDARSSDPRIEVDVVTVPGGADVNLRTAPDAKPGPINAEVVISSRVQGMGKPENVGRDKVTVTGDVQPRPGSEPAETSK